MPDSPKLIKRWRSAPERRVKEIIIRELNFNANLNFGYQSIIELEPDLLVAREKISWAII